VKKALKKREKNWETWHERMSSRKKGDHASCVNIKKIASRDEGKSPRERKERMKIEGGKGLRFRRGASKKKRSQTRRGTANQKERNKRQVAARQSPAAKTPAGPKRAISKDSG